jgi:uncharacterized protein (DUF1330 family)
MPKAYWVVTYRSMKNLAAWEAYAQLAKPAIRDAGGRFLALGKPAKTYELGMDQSVVIVEFDSLEQAIACHDTPAYTEALKALGTGNVERDIRIVAAAVT